MVEWDGRDEDYMGIPLVEKVDITATMEGEGGGGFYGMYLDARVVPYNQEEELPKAKKRHFWKSRR